MKENWQKDIHDRLGNYEKDAPEGLWKDIREKMSQTNGNYMQAEKTSFATRFRRVASVAVAASVALIIGYSIYSSVYDNQRQPTPETSVAQTDTNPAGQTEKIATEPPTSTENLLAEALPTTPARTTSRPHGQGNASTAVIPDGERPSPTTPSEVAAEAGKEKGNVVTENNKETGDDKAETRKDKNRNQGNGYADLTNYDDLIKRNRHDVDGSRWTVSTSAMGAVGTSKSALSIGEPIVSAGSEQTEWCDDPMMGINIYNQGRAVKTEYKHRHPVRVGLSVAYALNRRLSVESGLTYTRLTSEMKEGTDENYFYGEQKLNYVGVPAKVKYNAVSLNRLSLYGSAGVLVEKCVSGKMDKNYIINNVPKETETLDVDSKPLQLSVGASVGAQFDVADHVGVYVEPGLNYYFDDRSSLQTIYKEKPLNFSLNIGIRYTIGK